MARKRVAKKQKRQPDTDADNNHNNVEVLNEARTKLSDELLQACSKGDYKQAETLLEKGAFAWMQDDDGWTSLHFAAGVCPKLVLASKCVSRHAHADGDVEQGNASLVKLLLKNGAVWNIGEDYYQGHWFFIPKCSE
jgi:hypothetical protein